MDPHTLDLIVRQRRHELERAAAEHRLARYGRPSTMDRTLRRVHRMRDAVRHALVRADRRNDLTAACTPPPAGVACCPTR